MAFTTKIVTLNMLLTTLILLSAINTLPSTKDIMNHWCGQKDCYSIIGVNKTATTDDINKAYKKLAIK